MKTKQMIALIMAAALTVCVTGCGKSAESNDVSGNATYEETVRVDPDKGQDFDAYQITVTYTQEQGTLTSVEITSEWGIKRSENERYSSNALYQYTAELAAGKTSESGFDAATGATCASASLWNTYDNAFNAMGWSNVSQNIVPLVNGTVVEQSAHEEDAGAEDSQNAPDEEKGEKGEKGGKGDSSEKKGEDSLDVEVETRYLGEENGWRTYELVVPDGYIWTDVKLIRLNNSAYMPMKHDVTNIYEADMENGLFKLNMESDEAKAALDLTTLTIAAVLTSEADEAVTGTVHVEVDLTDTTITNP